MGLCFAVSEGPWFEPLAAGPAGAERPRSPAADERPPGRSRGQGHSKPKRGGYMGVSVFGGPSFWPLQTQPKQGYHQKLTHPHQQSATHFSGEPSHKWFADNDGGRFLTRCLRKQHNPNSISPPNQRSYSVFFFQTNNAEQVFARVLGIQPALEPVGTGRRQKQKVASGMNSMSRVFHTPLAVGLI